MQDEHYCSYDTNWLYILFIELSKLLVPSYLMYGLIRAPQKKTPEIGASTLILIGGRNGSTHNVALSFTLQVLA